MTITRIDHKTKAQGRVTEDLSKPNMLKLIGIYADELQYIEDAFLELAEQKSIEKAAGVWLDYVGKLLGVGREGMSDEDYRNSLYIKITASNSDGTPNSIIDIVTQYTSASDVKFTEGTLAWGIVYTNGKDNISGSLWDIVNSVKPVGTRIVIHSDYFDNAFLPAWESTEVSSENFTTTSDGSTFDTFQITSDGSNYEEFFTSSNVTNLTSSDISRSILEWEGSTASDFQVETGTGLEFLSLDVDGAGTLKQLQVALPPAGGSRRPLCWEVMEGAGTIVSVIPTQYGVDQWGSSTAQYGYIQGT